jgi:MOSC domain-containing protein YiiM
MNSKRIIKKIIAAARYESRLALIVEKRGQPGTYYRTRAAGMIAAARIIRKEEEPKEPRE